jgi:phage shock protein PspC (stress-responsive transcriptional regulator)
MFAGVAAGVAERLEADPALVRIAWAVLVFVTGGFALLVYIIMAFVVPEGPPPGVTWAAGRAPAGTDAAPPSGDVPAGEASTGSPGAWSPAPGRPVGRGGTAIVFGLILVLVGSALLLDRLVPSIDMGDIWPVIIIVLGAAILVGSVRRG